MNRKYIVKIRIVCHNAAELQRAQAAVLYHLETLAPKLRITKNVLTVSVIPIDPKLFYPEEACDIIRQTLAQSLTFTERWKCWLQTLPSRQAANTKNEPHQ